MHARKRGTCTSASDSQSSSQASASVFLGGILCTELSCRGRAGDQESSAVRKSPWDKDGFGRMGMMSQPANISRVPPWDPGPQRELATTSRD